MSDYLISSITIRYFCRMLDARPPGSNKNRNLDSGCAMVAVDDESTRDGTRPVLPRSVLARSVLPRHMPPRPFVLRVMRCLLALLGGGCRWLWSGRVALKLGVAQLVCPRLVHVGGRRRVVFVCLCVGKGACCVRCARGLRRSPQKPPGQPQGGCAA